MAKAILLILAAFWAFSIFSTIGQIGKHRGPVTPRRASTVTAILLVEIAAARYVYTQL